MKEEILLQHHTKIEFYIPNKEYKNFEKVIAVDKDGKEIQILKIIKQDNRSLKAFAEDGKISDVSIFNPHI